MVKIAEKKYESGNRWLPIIGVILAVLFGILAWVFSTPVMDYLAAEGIYQPGFLGKQFGASAELAEQLIIAGLLFFIAFGTMGFLISLLAGRTYDEDNNLKFRKETAKRRAQAERERELKRQRRQQRNKNSQ